MFEPGLKSAKLEVSTVIEYMTLGSRLASKIMPGVPASIRVPSAISTEMGLLVVVFVPCGPNPTACGIVVVPNISLEVNQPSTE